MEPASPELSTQLLSGLPGAQVTDVSAAAQPRLPGGAQGHETELQGAPAFVAWVWEELLFPLGPDWGTEVAGHTQTRFPLHGSGNMQL